MSSISPDSDSPRATRSTAKTRSASRQGKKEADQTTRGIILMSAIRHFAAVGYEGAHVRKMLQDAGVNMALAHYHFGSKAALYDAALTYYLAPVLADRRSRLDEWRAGDGPMEKRMADLFIAYIQPHFRIAAAPGGRDYARLMLHALSSENHRKFSLQAEIYALRAKYVEELSRLTPGLDAKRRDIACNALVSTMLYESLSLPAKSRDPDSVAFSHATCVARLISGGLLSMMRDGQP